jgi:hypothetical protein
VFVKKQVSTKRVSTRDSTYHQPKISGKNVEPLTDEDWQRMGELARGRAGFT